MDNIINKLDVQILNNLIVTKMPYGKYKGYYLHNIPVNYLEWFDKKGFPNSKLGMMLSTVLVIKSNGLEGLLLPLLKGKK